MTVTRMFRSILCATILAAPAYVGAQSNVAPARTYTDSAPRFLRLPGVAEDLATASLMGPITAAERAYARFQAGDSRQRVMVPVRVPAVVSKECPMPVAIDRMNAANGALRAEVMDSAAANPPGNVVGMPTFRSSCVNPLAR